MILSSQSSSDGKLRGRGGGAGRGLCNTFTNRVMFGPEGCRENGSFDASLMMARAGQTMISHLNGSFFAIAARRTDSLTSSHTTNVPTAPMLTMSNLANSFAISAGRHRFVPPTLTARRNTTEAIGEVKKKLKIRKFESGGCHLPPAFTGADMPPRICHVS